jgi:hypothetical protein
MVRQEDFEAEEEEEEEVESGGVEDEEWKRV